MVIAIIIAALLGLAAGISIGLVVRYERPIGDLRVDRSDPTSAPYLFLELEKDVHAIMRRKRVSLRVKLKDFIPHE